MLHALLDRLPVRSLKRHAARQLVVVRLRLLHDVAHLVRVNLQAAERGGQRLLPERLVWAAVVLARAGVGGDALHARVRRVVHALALLAVGVPHGVRVLLLELLRRDLLAELRLPEQHRLLQRQADAFHVELQLAPPLVPKVVLALHRVEQVLRAQRERSLRRARQVLERDRRARAVGAGLAGPAEVAPEVALGERHDDGREPLPLLAGDVLRPPPGRHREGLGQSGAEGAHHQRRELVARHVRLAAGHEDAAAAHEVGHLLERHGVEPRRARAEDLLGVVALHDTVERFRDALPLLGESLGRERLVFHVVVLEKRRLRERVQLVEPVLKQLALVQQEPPSQFLRAAVRQAKREVAHLVFGQSRAADGGEVPGNGDVGDAQVLPGFLVHQLLHLRGLLAPAQAVVDRLQDAHAVQRERLERLERDVRGGHIGVHGQLGVVAGANRSAGDLARGLGCRAERGSLGLVLLTADGEHRDDDSDREAREATGCGLRWRDEDDVRASACRRACPSARRARLCA